MVVRHIMMACIFAGLVAGVWAQEGTVHLRAPDGSWSELETNAADGTIHFTLTPDQVPDGRALVVINKPAWMVLEDDEAPAIAGYTIDGETTDLAAGDPIDLGNRSEAPEQMTIRVADDKNPIDPASVSIVTTGGALPIEIDASALGETDTAGDIVVSLADVEPGIYEATLQVADMSPQSNTATVPLRLSVFGASVGPGGQSVHFAGGGKTYQLIPDGSKFIAIGEGGPTMNLTVQAHGRYLYVNGFASAEEFTDDDGAAGVEIVCDLRDIDNNAVTNDEAQVEIAYDARLLPDPGCLLVTTHAKNLGDAADLYCFWGWVPGDGFITPDGEAHAWSMQYEKVGEVGWVFLPAKREGDAGVGWIAPHLFGQSRFGTMLLYTNPERIATETGAEVRMEMAVMSAFSAEEVEAAAAKLAEIGWPE